MKKLLLSGSMLTAFMASVSAQVNFTQPFTVTHEAVDTLELEVVAEEVGTDAATVNVSIVSGFGTASAADFTLLTPTLTFSESGTATVRVKIENDELAEKAEQFALQLSDPENTTLGDDVTATVFIKDNDYAAPVARENIQLEHLGSYKIDMPESSAEILAYDAESNRLFVVNSLQSYLHILDMSDPAALTEIDAINMLEYGGGITSVAVHDGVVAVAVHADPKTDNGKIVFLDTDGSLLNEVEAGALPDMVTFSPDGNWVIAANEGEPNGDYTVDPEGSVTVIDITEGVTAATATQVNFNSFDGMEDELRENGIRIYGYDNPTASQDFEPEYITVNETNDTAWISLQENNALAVLDLNTKTIIDIMPLGYVDHSLEANALDASDNNDSILIANWPVRGLYLPDGIASYSIGGQHYVVTANEGDAREYDPFAEEIRIKNGDYELDPTVFPNADLLKQDYNIGRLNAVSSLGDTDGDGDYDEIYVLGGRSFSIRNAADGSVAFNSGDQFEQIIANHPEYSAIFNASNEEENEVKNRSDNKGPEPESVTIGMINDTAYAFIGLERAGGVMVYDVTTPTAPVFVQYINTRDLTEFGGDNGAEGMIFLHKTANAYNEHLLITANETSGTVAVFKVNAAEAPTSINTPSVALKQLQVYPNPNEQGRLFFSVPVSGQLSDLSGRVVMTFEKANNINTSSLTPGMYFVNAAGFKAEKVMIK